MNLKEHHHLELIGGKNGGKIKIQYFILINYHMLNIKR